MRLLIIITFFLLTFFKVKGQNIDVPFSVVEIPPIFKGCQGNKEQLKKCTKTKLMKHFGKNFDIVGLAEELGLSSGRKRMYIKFVIDKSGNIVNIETKSTFSIQEIESEVKRVLKLLPKLSPGKQGNTPVRVSYLFPLVFVVDSVVSNEMKKKNTLEKENAYNLYVKNQKKDIANKIARKIYYKATGKYGTPSVSISNISINNDELKMNVKISWEETSNLTIMKLIRTIAGGKTKCWVKGNVKVDLNSNNEIKFRETESNDAYSQRVNWTKNGDVIIGTMAAIGYASWEGAKWAGRNGYLGDGTLSDNDDKPCYEIINKSSPNIINGMIKYTVKCRNGKTEIITYYPNKGEYSTTLLSAAFHKNLTFEDAIKDYCKCN